MFRLQSSPHIHSGEMTPKVMLWVMGALLPAFFVQCYTFGFGIFGQALIALSLTAGLEMLVAQLRQKPLMFYVSDGSGLLTALILAMAIPPYAPYWVIVIGILTAILLAKHCYGGMGQNLFNPAMMGYALLLVSFPVPMTSWLAPMNLLAEPLSWGDSFSLIFNGKTLAGVDLMQLNNSIDGLTQATPLNTWRTALSQGTGAFTIQQNPLSLDWPYLDWQLSHGWTWVNLAFLAGGLMLLVKKIIPWQTPLAMLTTFGVLAQLNYLLSNTPSPLWQLMSGSIIFGAFFIATDPVTAPLTTKGRFIFGAMVGGLVYLIRYYGGYPDGIAFAVLLSNIAVPLIDHYTRPRTMGYKK